MIRLLIKIYVTGGVAAFFFFYFGIPNTTFVDALRMAALWPYSLMKMTE